MIKKPIDVISTPITNTIGTILFNYSPQCDNSELQSES